jgi:HTH-type transcriptional regulator/antitoxin HigA
MNITLIKNKKDYEKTLKMVEKLWNAKLNTKEGDELDVLTTLIEKYENEQFPIEFPNPIEAIEFRMDQLGIEQKDLAKIIGANRISEILNKKRPLSINMIRILRKELKIPADSLIGNI